jgi:hypothetical protein
MECEFCHKAFSTKTVLLTHKKTAKYCLSLQGKENKDFQCQYCDKTFTLEHVLKEHLHSCKKKTIKEKEDKDLQLIEKYEEKEKQLKEKLEEKEKQILELKAKLEKFENAVIANSTKQSITTNITLNDNKMLNLNDNTKIQDFMANKITPDVLARGQEGLAEAVYNNLLKNDKKELLYTCVDTSRHIFEYINEKGEVERDVKANKLSKSLINNNLREIVGDQGKKLWTKEDGSTDSLRYQANCINVLNAMNMDTNSNKFCLSMAKLTS